MGKRKGGARARPRSNEAPSLFIFRPWAFLAMRSLLATLLGVALLASGCLGGEDEGEPAAPAATDDDGAPEAPPASDPRAAGGGNASSSSSSPPSSSSSSPPSSSSSATPPPVATPPPPPPPEPVAWELTSSVVVGYLAAFGAADESVAAPDDTHCADATFVVPDGVELLSLTVDAVAANPSASSPGAGNYAIHITAPDGSVTTISPISTDPESAGTEPSFVYEPETPLAGEYRIHAEPVGPAANQDWNVDIMASGASVEEPTDLAAVNACAM